ncbi:uncharacterized protein IL334_005280 [Kwoniella shivajii]|uniref:Uncharacterized protein n=1 Tax=Kwoniella shivajii TaxID=564305 RepID=A0ABZ1D2P8_9TREE|nr:hypothetical protein IL334_005280 [Kwoniella shivajii]
MSLLPQYRKDVKNDEESVPLFSSDDDSLPAYPPRVGESSGTTTHNVTYTFVPRWPIKGSQQDALGVLGESKEETIAIVQRGFNTLAEYSPDRIEFLSPVEVDSEGKVRDDRWGKVLDEAWPGFKSNPPRRLRVQIADGPGDEQRRNNREKKIVAAVVTGIFSPFVLFGILGISGFFD